MRKVLILCAGVALAGVMFIGTPAKAEMGCACVKLGQNAMCVDSIATCMNKVGGVCMLPCDYQGGKKAMKRSKKKKG